MESKRRRRGRRDVPEERDATGSRIELQIEISGAREINLTGLESSKEETRTVISRVVEAFFYPSLSRLETSPLPRSSSSSQRIARLFKAADVDTRRANVSSSSPAGQPISATDLADRRSRIYRVRVDTVDGRE